MEAFFGSRQLKIAEMGGRAPKKPFSCLKISVKLTKLTYYARFRSDIYAKVSRIVSSQKVKSPAQKTQFAPRDQKKLP